MRHLTTLGLAGVTHVHLLPAFDFATTNEDKTTWQSPSFDTLAALPGRLSRAAGAGRGDRGSRCASTGATTRCTTTCRRAATRPNADGSARILEFRQMVQSLNQSGLRVVMDVVYNHTNSAGQNPNSILDKLVPGYYHRLNGDGVVLGESCCADTATEHAMMEKLMVDSIVLWAKAYKVDGFRFDIMGFHLKSNMLKVRAALDALTRAKDGVDGKSIYLYGEAWNFGVMANNGRGVNAIQVNMAGTGIGSFSDRIRDAVRGGGPFSPRRDQGFATGLYVEPNGTFGGSAADAEGGAAAAHRPGAPGARGQHRELRDRRRQRRDASPAERSTISACPAPSARNPKTRSSTSACTTIRTGSMRMNLKLACRPCRAPIACACTGSACRSWRSRRACPSSWPATRSCAPSPPTATATTPATGSIASTGR